ncbi:MAG: FHA domain-containing protein [Gammaproteobacteria bacterium]|nr:FHA domain-containing protein [Gammaproteobacteria bacterium]
MIFDKQQPRPLTLEIEGRSLTFLTLADFEFALASRTEVPADKITRLVRLSDKALKQEARAIRSVEKHFVDLVADDLQDRRALGRDLRLLDIQQFSQDHQWRTIMSRLREQGSDFDAFKKAALVKYMQYLAARQEVIRSISAERQHRASSSPSQMASEEPAAVQPHRDTLDFESTAGAGEPAATQDLLRLPKGEAVSIQFPVGHEVPLFLAGHRFVLVGEEGSSRLVDDNDDGYILQRGKNLIGRDLGNHVVLDSSYRDLSRKHLLIDLADWPVVHLTDMSSLGTFIHADLVRAG